MKIIKSFIGNLILVVLTTLSACNGNSETVSVKLEKTFNVGNYNVRISFPKNWKVESDMAPFDLQCSDGNSYASVFVFYNLDLPKEKTPLDFFYIQNDEVFSKRLNVEVIKEKETERYGNKQIHSMLYSAEKDAVKNYYYCNLVEFGKDSDRFVWIMFTGMPSYALDNIEDWEKIVASIKVE